MKMRSPIAMGLALAGCVAVAAPAFAADRIEKTFNLQPGGRFRLETGMGRVRLTGKPGAGVHFVVTSRGRDLDDLLVNLFHGTGGADDVGEFVPFLQFATKVRVFVQKPLPLIVEKMIGFHGLCHHRCHDAEAV